jgi:hypothetical protein
MESSTEKQVPRTDVDQKPRRPGQFAPGVSGNPLGRSVTKVRTERRLAELFEAVAADFPAPSPCEVALLQQAARLLLRAERSTKVRYRDGDVAVRCANGARRILASLQHRRRETAPPSPWSPMRERAGMCDPAPEKAE